MAEVADPLDPERLAMLRELDSGDGTLLTTLATEYANDAERQLTAIRAGIAAGDAHAVERAAHGLKGASANLGADAMAELCLRLERQCRAQSLDGADDLADTVESELHRVVAALRRATGEG